MTVLQTRLKDRPDWLWVDRKTFFDVEPARRERDAYRRLATSIYEYRIVDQITREVIN